MRKSTSTYNFDRSAMASDTISVDFSKKTGKRIMPLHGVNSGPRTKSFVYDARPQFVKLGIPSVRLHDVEYPFGSGEYVDIPCIFKNFDADENDPASYNFALTDEYIRASLSVGSKIFYRLGVSIEHSPVKRYTFPPKDYAKWARICEHIIRHYNEGWADGHHWSIEHWEIWNESDAESTKTWAGTQRQFIEFYTVAAKHLKSCFPSLKIGGCGFTGGRPDNVELFLDGISENGAPLDFLSFHTYSNTPDKALALWNRFRKKLNAVGYPDAETMLTEWNYMGSWDSKIQPLYYPAMKDHRGAAFYGTMLCAMQRYTDLTLAHYFEADVVKEFCGIFDVEEMRVSITNPAKLKPTKGFYAFKYFNMLYRMGNEAEISENEQDTVYALAACGEAACGDPACGDPACGDPACGVVVASQADFPVKLQLSLKGASGDLTVRVTDGIRTNEVLRVVCAEEAESFSVTLPPHSLLYVGTDLCDSTPTYEENPYRSVSTAAPKDAFFD